MPQININGQASYQSEVVELPVKAPGIDIPDLTKDQYKIYADLNQLVYDGGLTKWQKQSQKTSGEVEKQKVEIELYKLKRSY